MLTVLDCPLRGSNSHYVCSAKSNCYCITYYKSRLPFLLSYAYSLPPLAPLAAGHITSIEELSAYFSAAFGSGPHTVLLFLQDKVGLHVSSCHQ